MNLEQLIVSALAEARTEGIDPYGVIAITPKTYWKSHWNVLYRIFGWLPVFAMDDRSKTLWYALKSRGHRPKVTYPDSSDPKSRQQPILAIVLG